MINLNPDQQAVVDHDGHSLVVACPGSGKTRVIIEKIARILSGSAKDRVCAVTFTRDSANELKARLVKAVSSEIVNKRSRVGTFHSLAIRQLRGCGKVGKVASPAEQQVFVQRALAASEAQMTFEEAVQLIETVKSSRGASPEEDSPLYQHYAALLKRANIEDLYDVLKKSLLLMQKGELPPYPVEYMLVDEFQDTDEIQLAWVLEHVKAGTRVTVVGDDDQSVYSFRRALGYQGMERFRQATDATLIALGTNYRCRAEVLSAAERLILGNTERINKGLKAARGPGGAVRAVRHASRTTEAAALADELTPLLQPLTGDPTFQYTVPAGSWAVLARNRRTLDAVETELQQRRIRYIRPPSESIWNRPPFVFFIGLMRSIQTGSPDGIDHAFHFAGIPQEHIEIVHDAFNGDVWRLLDGHLPPLAAFPDPVVAELKEFAACAKGWRDQVRKGAYSLAVTTMADWFEKRIRGKDELELFSTIAGKVAGMYGTLSQRANTLTLPVQGSSDDGEAPSGVALMTMHGSKGLEFENVWIVAAEDGVIPSPKNPVYDEERRLMYVAMTRAKNQLIMSSRVTEPPSPFLVEAGFDPRGT